MKKLDTLIAVDENGETFELDQAKYIKKVIKDYNIKTEKIGDMGDVPAEQLVKYLIKTADEDQDVEEAVLEKFSEAWETIKADVLRTKEGNKDLKAKAESDKKKREAEEAEAKKKREEEEAKLSVVRGGFAEKFVEGVRGADAEFLAEVTNLAQSLPDGVSVTEANGGYGIKITEDTSAETIGSTLGFLHQKSVNSDQLKGQAQFWSGDLINASVDRRIFPTAKEAGKFLHESLAKVGIELSPAILDNYKRMAERTPIELRNPKVPMVNYYKIAMMPLPKKGSNETQEQFKERVQKMEKDREALQLRVHSGEFKKSTDVATEIDKILVEHGLKKKADPNEVNIVEQKEIFLHASLALEDLVGSGGEEDAVVYKQGDKTFTVTKEELTERRDAAKAHIVNYYYANPKKGITYKDLVRGHVVVEKEVTVKTASGPVKQINKVKTPVFPEPFWDVKDDEGEKAEETPSEFEDTTSENEEEVAS